jgi:NADH-quinone oxidoreductase subunit L
MILSTVAGLAGIGAGWLLYGKTFTGADPLQKKLPAIHQVLNRKYYVDELYEAMIVKPLRGLGNLLHLLDDGVVDGIVRLFAKAGFGVGRLGLGLQNGNIQTYGLVTLLGLVVLAVLFVGGRLIYAG